jgi:hypothetical protein
MGYRAQVSALGAQRRIQALVAIGYTFPMLSKETGLSEIYLRQLAHGIRSTRIDRRRDAKIREVYRTLCVQPLHKGYGPKRARLAAKAAGWYPPMAWDDIDSEKDRPSYYPKRRYA